MRDELSLLTFEDVLLLLENKIVSDSSLPIPKELYKLANYILKEGKLKPNIFLNSGNAS